MSKFKPTKDQAAASENLEAWRSQREVPFFNLKGYAGTGKTTAIQQFIQGNSSVVMCAPTHKAAGVLARSAEKWGAGSVDCRTLHSLLALRKSYDRETGETIFVPDTRRDPPVSEYSLVILDECSMIGTDLWDLVVQAQKMWGNRWVLMGDPLQLPPIGEDSSPTFDLEWGSELREIVRYSGCIAKAVGNIRDNITSKRPRLPTSDAADESGSIEFKLDLDFMNSFLDEVMANPAQTKALAWTNKSVDWINDWVRRQIFGDSVAPFMPGERVVAVETITVKDDSGFEEVLLHTEDGCVVDEVKSANYLGCPCWKLLVQTDFGQVAWVHALDETQELIWSRKLAKVKRKAQETKEWRDYFELKEGFARLRAGYATTVHKSQGSTYESVYIALSDIVRCPDHVMRNKLLYVAFSRASQKLVLYSRHQDT